MSTPPSPSETASTDRKCTHEGCSCSAASASREGRYYCSDGCAAGTGCSHPDCNCAAYAAQMRGE